MTAEPSAPPRQRPRPVPDNTPPDTRTPPHDAAAEAALLGAALNTPTAITDALAQQIQPSDFYRPTHETLWRTLLTLNDRGAPTDPVAVLTELTRAGNLRPGQLDAPTLHTLMHDAPPAPNADYYAQIIHQHARRRRLLELGGRLTQIAHSPSADPEDVTQAYEAALARVVEGIEADDQPVTAQQRHVPDVDEFLNAPDAEYDWLIPGILERQDRLMLTGPEGGGKSTFCRQLATMAAAGIHPFTGEIGQPIRVLLLDLENSEHQARRALRPLRLRAGELLDPTNLRIEIRPGGIDLLDPADTTWITDVTAAARPDLLITGPLYRMASGDPVEEKTARPVSQALDRIRDTGCAIVIETHAPHAAAGQRKRPRRPYGASLWVRWPEFGLWLDEDGTLEHWRGARDTRDWPAALKRGGDWPWTPNTDPAALLWARIRQARDDFGEPMSLRDLEDAVGTSKSTIHRCLRAHSDEWKEINGSYSE